MPASMPKSKSKLVNSVEQILKDRRRRKSRRAKEHAQKMARCIEQFHSLVEWEEHHLAKSKSKSKSKPKTGPKPGPKPKTGPEPESREWVRQFCSEPSGALAGHLDRMSALFNAGRDGPEAMTLGDIVHQAPGDMLYRRPRIALDVEDKARRLSRYARLVVRHAWAPGSCVDLAVNYATFFKRPRVAAEVKSFMQGPLRRACDRDYAEWRARVRAIVHTESAAALRRFASGFGARTAPPALVARTMGPERTKNMNSIYFRAEFDKASVAVHYLRGVCIFGASLDLTCHLSDSDDE